jgi:hypothetical protein
MKHARLWGILLSTWFFAWSAEAANVNATLRLSPDRRAGTDSEGRVLLFTPKPLQPGSSHSHFESLAFPNLLMEPNASPDLRFGRVDLTKKAMQDLGWRLGSLAAQIEYSDNPQEGFNDSDLGNQRRAALESAVDTWSRILGSAVTVNVEALFADLACDDDGATLASAGPRFVFQGFPGGEPGVWYPGPLAESLSNQNLSLSDTSNPDSADVRIRFNSAIDSGCLGPGSRFYYGLDANIPTGQIPFAMVALHEMGYGLGFLGLVDLATGEFFRGASDPYTNLTYDTKKEKHWDEMTRAQRRKSAVRSGKVSFDGRKTTRRARRFLNGAPVVEIHQPSKLAGDYIVGTATFGPPLKKAGITGDLALADDGSPQPTFACRPLINGAEVAGKIAVIDRGDCFFVEKVKNAQDAGAIGVIIVHNEAGLPPGLGGSDDSIVIPSVRIGRSDGRKIKRNLRQ